MLWPPQQRALSPSASETTQASSNSSIVLTFSTCLTTNRFYICIYSRLVLHKEEGERGREPAGEQQMASVWGGRRRRRRTWPAVLYGRRRVVRGGGHTDAYNVCCCCCSFHLAPYQMKSGHLTGRWRWRRQLSFLLSNQWRIIYTLTSYCRSIITFYLLTNNIVSSLMC